MNEGFLDKIAKLGKPIIDLVENNTGKLLLLGLAGVIFLIFMLKG